MWQHPRVDEKFREGMRQGFAFTEPTVVLGNPMLNSEVVQDVRVQAKAKIIRLAWLALTEYGQGRVLQCNHYLG